MRGIATLTLACLLLLVGCQSASTTEAPPTQAERPALDLPSKPVAFFAFSPEHYPAVHTAAVEVLRSHGFRIARNDYRFGTITTYPKEAATTAEFWIDDATTRDQRLADTLNAQQRSVTIRVQRPEEQTRFILTVEVLIERLQRPERYLTHSASTRITASYTAVPTHLNQRGIDGPYAQSLSRDPHLEARLLQAIKAATDH